MKKIIRYGKSSDFLSQIKDSFFQDNDKLLQYSQRMGQIYLQQPLRKNCKCCEAALSGGNQVAFVKQGIPYVVCNACSHLNGRHEDSTDYNSAIYTEDAGKDYAKVYSSND